MEIPLIRIAVRGLRGFLGTEEAETAEGLRLEPDSARELSGPSVGGPPPAEGITGVGFGPAVAARTARGMR